MNKTISGDAGALTLVNPPTCGQCAHWHKAPPDPTNLGQQLGECREAPPTSSPLFFPHGHGGQVQLQVVGFNASYPKLQPEFPACSRFAPRED